MNFKIQTAATSISDGEVFRLLEKARIELGVPGELMPLLEPAPSDDPEGYKTRDINFPLGLVLR